MWGLLFHVMDLMDFVDFMDFMDFLDMDKPDTRFASAASNLLLIQLSPT